jgi:hypothetical protein
VNQFGLGRGHPADTVTSRDFAARGDGAVTADADPQHPQRAKRLLPPLLGRGTTEEDLVNDDPGSGMSHRSEPGDPGCLKPAELRPDDDLAL